MNLGTVLVLEDEPFIALDMEDMLKGYGACSVISFDTRAEALIWLASNRPRIAVVDPRLNDGVCTDVVEALAEASVPFIVYSGAEVDETVRYAFEKGAWLAKPTMPEMLEEMLGRLIAAG
ncbi:hypothetical protein ASE04_18820 [Rhizobium sp. Root708]|uniref:response regulator n=1 Tax=Rhizobium sp. Root708 TaxID=1736592 RepID=UPI0006F8F02D|nr:response regulator [Rhizobium sp. Root708]KRB49226.1 hypothetical protein ASE04_18820 [Rhizobium sp. Root708]